MTKQKTIAKAYGEHWDKSKKYVDIDGWIDFAFAPEKFLREKKFDAITNKEERLLRPKSLAGIETNNGWIKIESEADLPRNEDLEYKVGTFINNKFYLSGGVYDYQEVRFSFNNNHITHYQPIIKPQPPIY